MVFEHFYGRRSDVLATRGAVATSDPIASEIGLRLLKDGANAAEAAVGIAAALNLVDPGSTGLGGDCFVLFYDAQEKTVKGINASGRSPSALTLDLLREYNITQSSHAEIPLDSAFVVTVPGAPAGWIDCYERLGTGKYPLTKIFEPTIQLAENGFPVHEVSAKLQQENFSTLKPTSNGSQELLVNSRPPEAGQIITNPNYAQSLKALIADGKKPFYEGKIAQRIVAEVQSHGGCLTMEDMQAHFNTYEDPISTKYRDVTVWEAPPNGQGIVALMGFNILEGYDLSKESRLSSSCLHKMIEATHLAFADGFKHVADPAFSQIPIDQLLSKERADGRRKLILNDRKNGHSGCGLRVGDDTVYFSVVDEQGNACSFINSIYNYYGSGLVPKHCGYALQSRGRNFSLDPGHQNCVAPGKRSYHTIIPGMLTRGDELYACFGVMGGFMQPQGHIQVISNMVDFGMNPQLALDYPRFCINYPHNAPALVFLESSIPDDVIEELRKMGHNVVVKDGFERMVFGRGQIIRVQNAGDARVLWSGSESSADGCAMGYSA